MFEFDPAKSAANKAKHGIDFVEAQALWDGPVLLKLATVDYDGETRELFVGTIAGRHWTAVVTRRGGSIRIISVRRARRSEEMAFDRGRIR
ncbi:MAG: BrnT family toxin [Pseudomonadota bacterium]